jgi:hypothetical protein
MSKCTGCDQHNAVHTYHNKDMYCDDCYEEHNYMLNMIHAIHMADCLIDEEFDNED